MKKFFVLVFAAAAMLCFSCSDDDNGSDRWLSYGEVSIEGDQVVIVRDDWARLIVTESAVPAMGLQDGERVIVSYTILSQTATQQYPQTMQVRLYGVYDVLCKAPLEASFIAAEPAREDSIGNDPLYVYDAWFGGKYLNLNLGFFMTSADRRHFLNLVHEEDIPGNDTVYLTLHHNAYDPTFKSDLFGRVSFDLSGLVPEGGDGMPVRLTWNGYNGMQSDTGTFSTEGGAPRIAPAQAKTHLIPTKVE